MRLSKLVQSLDIKEVSYDGEWESEIFSLFTDSRNKVENGLFFCLKGEHADGHAFAEEVVKNGAVAIVTERVLEINVPQIIVPDTRKALGILASVFYGEPSEKMKVIGITGTNGKTTTAHMLASILRSAEKKVGIIGTLGVEYENKRYSYDLTTPDPIDLERTLAEMFLHGVEYVVMEVSAHALYYKKVAGIRFAACIFTNFTQDHLDFFGTMNEYKKAKEGLFHADVCPIAVINGDDETGRAFGQMRVGEGLKTSYYGLNMPADSFAVITDETLYGTECMLNINDDLSRVSLSTIGRHNVYNALAAATCAVNLGIPSFLISKGFASLDGVSGRLERVASYQGAEVFVDFAHTPDGLEKSLDTLRSFCKGRLICLFGCGGNRDKSKRPIMGEVVAKKSDFAVLTSDNPRYEDPLDILSGIEKGYRRFSVRYVVVPDRKRAIGYALELLKKGDVLLVAGKGGENYQEIMGIKYPFNDNDIIKKILENQEKW